MHFGGSLTWHSLFVQLILYTEFLLRAHQARSQRALFLKNGSSPLVPLVSVNCLLLLPSGILKEVILQEFTEVDDGLLYKMLYVEGNAG